MWWKQEAAAASCFCKPQKQTKEKEFVNNEGGSADAALRSVSWFLDGERSKEWYWRHFSTPDLHCQEFSQTPRKITARHGAVTHIKCRPSHQKEPHAVTNRQWINVMSALNATDKRFVKWSAHHFYLNVCSLETMLKWKKVCKCDSYVTPPPNFLQEKTLRWKFEKHWICCQARSRTPL